MHTYASTATNPEPGNVARNAITVATAIVLAVIMTATAAVGLEAPPDHDFPIEDPLPPCEWRIPTIVVQPGGAPVEGTPGNDVIRGTSGDDVIDAGDGDDLICAGGGDDTVEGGWGSDVIYGEAGADDLWAVDQAGTTSSHDIGDHDEVHGGGGTDEIVGNGLGSSELYGGSHADVIEGGKFNDVITGGLGDDDLYGNGGADEIDGGSGWYDHLDAGVDDFIDVCVDYTNVLASNFVECDQIVGGPSFP